MRVLPVPAVAAFVLLLPLCGVASGGELAERAAIRNHVVALVRSEQFAEVETLAAEFRSSQSRSPSGLWHLTLFYIGINAAFDARRDDGLFWARAERSATRWTAAYPDSPTPHLAYARMLINRGWSIRGSGYADTVRPQDWEPFRHFLQQASRYLDKHKSVASADPHWYELKAIVAYGLGWPEPVFAKLISEGLRRAPLFYQLHFAAIDYYTPKWGGSGASVEAFARKALKRTRSAEGFGMYARIYWYASQTQYGNRLFTNSLVHWPTMKKGIDDVLKRYPDAWNVNNFARFACLSKDREKTAELMARIDGEPVLSAWRPRSLYQQCQDWARG